MATLRVSTQQQIVWYVYEKNPSPLPSSTPPNAVVYESDIGQLTATKPSGLPEPYLLPNSGVGGYSFLVTTFGNTSFWASSDAPAQ
jgi:hypothetical protein